MYMDGCMQCAHILKWNRAVRTCCNAQDSPALGKFYIVTDGGWQVRTEGFLVDSAIRVLKTPDY